MNRSLFWLLILAFLALDVLIPVAAARASYDLMHMLTGR